MNRSENDEERVCDTVKQKNQFSWVKPNKTSPKVTESEAWFKSMNLAQEILDGKKKDPTKGATHFYRADIYPHWADECKKKKRLGKQVFCQI
jgi:spore germination cell wall hydrolase CwlJ-like protein